MLPRADVLKVATFVHSLSNPNSGTDNPKMVEAGKTIFAVNCVSCHGEDAKATPNWARPTWPTVPGSMAAIWKPSTHRFGADGRAVCRREGRLSALDRKIRRYLVDKGHPTNESRQ
jgi:cytochrome c oxidase cbb3-type subunit 3